jgi:biopolymer transport protein ExbD
MASIDTGKKGAPHIDMTPMVDLGFLLITFFMLSTTFSKPKTMEIIKPAKEEKEDDRPPVKKSKTMSILLGENNKAYYYVGTDEEIMKGTLQLDSADFSATGIRKAILNRQLQVQEQWGDKNELIVLIKSMGTAKYKNMVDILDEMNITGTKKYALVDLDKLDSIIINQIRKN